MEKDCDDLNRSLQDHAREILRRRRQQIQSEENILASFGVPIHRNTSIPATFAVPIAPKRAPVASSTSANLKPEPCVAEDVYENMLQIFHGTGTAMERAPSLFTDKGEEALRDQFVMTLGTHYPAFSEAKNRAGKTDILLRHETGVLFVTECKFWKGEKHYREAISQILTYLTWRESKAAILCFIRTKELQPVLDQIVPATEAHGCFVSARKQDAPSRFDFNLHLPDDRTRGVRLAVLCFHFPPGSQEPSP